jgi:GNAT superfamily N-acetyltransferase
MEPAVLGWPPDGPTLRLDHRRFSYAGKFVMSNTGKAAIRDPGAATDGEYDDSVLAAVAFNADRTDSGTLWLRYVTVRNDRRGEGLAPRLCRFLAGRAAERGYDRLRIAVNNPFAYEALYRAGFAYTGERTGIAELILERPADAPVEAPDPGRYRDGLEAYAERELSAAEREFLEEKREAGPPRAR